MYTKALSKENQTMKIVMRQAYHLKHIRNSQFKKDQRPQQTYLQRRQIYIKEAYEEFPHCMSLMNVK